MPLAVGTNNCKLFLQDDEGARNAWDSRFSGVKECSRRPLDQAARYNTLKTLSPGSRCGWKEELKWSFVLCMWLCCGLHISVHVQTQVGKNI